MTILGPLGFTAPWLLLGLLEVEEPGHRDEDVPGRCGDRVG